MQILNGDIAPVMIFLGTGQTLRHVRTLEAGEEWEAPDSDDLYWADSGKVTFDGER